MSATAPRTISHRFTRILRFLGRGTCLGRWPLSRNPLLLMEMSKPSICVFCGASFGNDPRFRDVARAVGEGIGRMGYNLVFGGGALGLMGEVAKAAQDAGAEVQGIIPAF